MEYGNLKRLVDEKKKEFGINISISSRTIKNCIQRGSLTTHLGAKSSLEEWRWPSLKHAFDLLQSFERAVTRRGINNCCSEIAGMEVSKRESNCHLQHGRRTMPCCRGTSSTRRKDNYGSLFQQFKLYLEFNCYSW